MFDNSSICHHVVSMEHNKMKKVKVSEYFLNALYMSYFCHDCTNSLFLKCVFATQVGYEFKTVLKNHSTCTDEHCYLAFPLILQSFEVGLGDVSNYFCFYALCKMSTTKRFFSTCTKTLFLV